MVEKHFVRFYSPGTFFAEMSEYEIESFDVDTAIEMSESVTERWNARPYGFVFITRSRGDDDLDSSETYRSPMHYFNVNVKTMDEIKAENNPQNEILISNMEMNGWSKVVESKEGWKVTLPLREEDIVLSDKPID